MFVPAVFPLIFLLVKSEISYELDDAGDSVL